MDFRIFFSEDGKAISPWHNVPPPQRRRHRQLHLRDPQGDQGQDGGRHRRGAHADQAGHQEGQAPRLPVQHQLELRHDPPDLGGPEPRAPNDDGELDWKVIAISAADPKAGDINDVEDVEKHFPGELEKIRVWFRDYKTPDGKPQNKFGLDDKCMNKEYTMGVIEETSKFYQDLMSGKTENTKGLSLK